MVIAVASGKGGTGKTTVATNMASLLAESGREVAYLDCDVEAPNGHIFLKPEIHSQTSVGIPVPIVDSEKCTLCGKCAEICQYGAILCLGEQVTVFPDLCHGCGGCTRVCPDDAIHEKPKEIGLVEVGESGAIHCVQGRLNVGQALSPPLIREVKKRTPGEGIRIVDCPPGTSCPAIQSVRGADFVLMVAEPTPFGLNDLRLGAEMLRVLGLPFGVVVNRADIGNGDVRQYCAQEGIEVLLEIPDDRGVAEAYSRGQLATAMVPGYRERLETLFPKVEGRAAR
jgi:MinD superfamily P-loop ATPase